MRRLLSATFVAAALVTVGLAPAPAHAVPAAPTFSGLDTSVPGHITGTVTSDQPFVWVRMDNDTETTPVAMAPDGTGFFDLETWGYGASSGSTYVEAVACPTSTIDSTCSPVGASATFAPSDVTPQVTWFADDTIGPGQADPAITVSDTGGGELHAIFVNSDGDNASAQLAHNGTTTLPVTDGTGYVRITRCEPGSTTTCSSAGFTAPLEHDLDVRRSAVAFWDGGQPATVASPNPSFSIDTYWTNGPYSLTWHLTDPDTGTVVPSVGGTVTGSVVNGTAAGVTIDTTGVADGGYGLVGTITIDDPDFGTYADVPVISGYLLVAKTNPAVVTATASPARIYPRISRTGYPSWTTVTFTGSFPTWSLNAQVRSASGATVARPHIYSSSASTVRLDWDGRNDDGIALPAGTYHVVLVDQWGNQGTKAAQVVVDGRRLVTKTFTRTLRARSSKVFQEVGRCSSLKYPATRGWRGSMSLQSNTKCRRGTNASVVATAHQVKLPSAAAYLNARVDVYGGAARRRAGSSAFTWYLTSANGDISTPRQLGPRVGNHAGARMPASQVVLRDSTGSYLVWYVAVAKGHRYDVKSFTVNLTYQVLG